MVNSTLVIERKGAGLGWAHFCYAGESIGEAMAKIAIEKTFSKDKGLNDKFRIVRVTREILSEPT